MNNTDIKDPREEGVGGLKGINRTSPSQNQEDYLNILSKFNPDFSSVRESSTMSQGAVENIGNKYEGYGESIFDNNAVYEGQLEDINELRAQEQPWYAQLAAGTAKMGIYAGTTFADGIAGTAAGILNVITNADKIAKSDNGWREAGNLFINNPISVGLQEINDWSEKALPNYYSKEELERPWYENIFTANFIGDKFIKNLGFTIGAAYSGKVNAGMLSKAMGLAKVRDAFKGMTVLTKEGKQLTTANEIANAYRRGDAFIDGVQLTEELGNAAKKLKAGETTLKTLGAISAAAGEGRVEAITNSKQFEEYHRQLLDTQYKKDIDNIENQLYEEHPDWFTYQLQPSLEGGFKGGRTLKNEYIPEWNRRKEELDNKYKDAITFLEKGTASMANTDFLFNLLLLSATDLYQFGRFYAGGYNTGKLATGVIKNGKKDVEEIIKKSARIVGIPLSEGPGEEMGQSWISESAGLYQAAKLNQFYGKSLDPEASEELANSLNAAVQGFKNTYGNIDAWEEGFIGMLTPGVMLNISRADVKGKDGNIKKKWVINNEIYDSIKDLYTDVKNADTYIQAYNNRINSPEFRNYYDGLVRHNSYQKDMDKALTDGDNFSYKNSEYAQLINDFLIFERADRLDELTELIDSMGLELIDEDIKQIKEQSVNKEIGKSIFDGMSDDDIRKHIKKQAKDIKDKLETYKQISTDLKTLYGEDLRDDYLSELVYGFTTIDNLEKRAKELFSSINKTLQDKGIEIGRGEKIDFNNIVDLLTAVSSEDKNIINEINQIIRNKNLPIQKRNVMIAQRITKRVNNNENQEQSSSLKRYIKEALQRIEKNKDKLLSPLDVQTLTEQLIDLAKIQAQRVDFIDTYTTLSKNPELFSKQNAELLEALQRESTKKIIDSALIEVEKANNLSEFKNIINKKYSKYKKDIYDRIKSGENEELKKYAENNEKLENSTKVLTDIVKSLDSTPANVSAVNVIQDAFENSQSVEEALDTIQEFTNNTIPEIKEAIDNILNKYNEQLKNKKVIDKDEHQESQPLQKPIEESQNTKGVKEQKGKGTSSDLFAEVEEEKPIDKDSDKQKSINEENKSISEDNEEQKPQEQKNENKLDNILNELRTKSLDELKNIAENGYSELSEQDNKAIKNLARLIYNEKILPNINGDELVEQEDINTPNIETAKKQLLRSWIETEYDFNGLNDRIHRKAIKRNNPIVKALSNLGVYQFVDDGYLADMLAKNPELPIHITVSNDPVFKDKLLLAVELRENDKGINPITGNDDKKYQVVGILGMNSKNHSSVSAYNSIFGVVMDSYNDFIKDNSSINSSLYISPLSTQVTHIYSGRMVKSTEENPEVTFRDVTKEFMRGRPAKFGICYPNLEFKTPTLNNGEIIVQPNLNNTNPREGSIYLMTKEADGRWYPKAVRLKRFTQSEYPLDIYGDTPIMNSIREALKILVNPNETQYRKALAKFELESYLVFPKNHDLVFTKEGNILSVKGIKNNIAGNASTIEEAVENTINALMDETLNLRFAFSTYKTIESSYIDDILESGIIETDLYQPSNVNASFDIASIDNIGKPIVDEEQIIVGHTGRQGINNSLAYEKVFNNGVNYSISSEGVVIRENGEVIQDKDKIQEVLFQSQVNRGIVNPIEGNEDLYVSTYENGTKFGIMNNKVITGPLLTQFIEKAKKKAERQKKKEELLEASKKALENGDLFASVPETSDSSEENISPEELTNDLFAQFTKEEPVEEASIEQTQPIEMQDIEKSNIDSSKRFIMTDEFVKRNETKSPEERVKEFAAKQRKALKELNFKNTQEFIDFCKDPKNKLPNLSTITTQEEFDTLVKLIKECR